MCIRDRAGAGADSVPADAAPGTTAAALAGSALAPKPALPTFKQYREPDGRFAFKLTDARGHLLLQSASFASPQAAALAIARLKAAGYAASPELHPLLRLGGTSPEGSAGSADPAAAAQAAEAALEALRAAS